MCPSLKGRCKGERRKEEPNLARLPAPQLEALLGASPLGPTPVARSILVCKR